MRGGALPAPLAFFWLLALIEVPKTRASLRASQGPRRRIRRHVRGLRGRAGPGKSGTRLALFAGEPTNHDETAAAARSSSELRESQSGSEAGHAASAGARVPRVDLAKERSAAAPARASNSAGVPDRGQSGLSPLERPPPQLGGNALFSASAAAHRWRNRSPSPTATSLRDIPTTARTTSPSTDFRCRATPSFSSA
jgi:hypothetical protein